VKPAFHYKGVPVGTTIIIIPGGVLVLMVYGGSIVG